MILGIFVLNKPGLIFFSTPLHGSLKNVCLLTYKFQNCYAYVLDLVININ